MPQNATDGHINVCKLNYVDNEEDKLTRCILRYYIHMNEGKIGDNI